jgi:UrcA family protein
MDNRNIACAVAAVVVGAGLIASASSSSARPHDVTVVAKHDPSLERRVSYADLNLAYRPGQQILKARIVRTADQLCFDLNGPVDDHTCPDFAVRSTRTQVAAAIERAKRRMAGLPVGPAIAISMATSAQ